MAYRRGAEWAHWVENPTYEQWHRRMREWKGKASAHPCTECGRQAAHWAYVGSNTGPKAYSTDVDDYVPMCALCHKQRDMRLLMEERSKDTTLD